MPELQYTQVRVSRAVHQWLKVEAAKRGMTMNQFLELVKKTFKQDKLDG